jgi:hypothetical protein
MTDVDLELLKQLHRRWLETREPKDGDRLADLISILARRKR